MTDQTHFGVLPNGQDVQAYRIAKGGLSANILDYGATLQGLCLDGHEPSLVIGSESLADYLGAMRYYGAIVGRVSNRIANARYEFQGQQVSLDRNFRERHILHGGQDGVGQLLWSVVAQSESSLELSLVLADGHMGFPGELTVQVRYAINDDARLTLEIEARSTKATPCSFAQHSYFNLSGSAGIQDHELSIAAGAYLPVDEDLIPLGRVATVSGTPWDFQQCKRLGEFPYDHNFCVSEQAAKTPQPCAVLKSPNRRLVMELASTEPGLQLYTASQQVPLAGSRAMPFCGVALEPQAWPDAVNQPQFPSAMLLPGDTYTQTSSFAFKHFT